MFINKLATQQKLYPVRDNTVNLHVRGVIWTGLWLRVLLSLQKYWLHSYKLSSLLFNVPVISETWILLMFCWPLIYYLLDVIDLDVLTKSCLALGASLTPSLLVLWGEKNPTRFFVFSILWCKCIMWSRNSCNFLVNFKNFLFLISIGNRSLFCNYFVLPG